MNKAKAYTEWWKFELYRSSVNFEAKNQSKERNNEINYNENSNSSTASSSSSASNVSSKSNFRAQEDAIYKIGEKGELIAL